MQLDSTFTVLAPIETVWETLMDFERVAGCVPGAEVLNKLSDDAYQVGMKVKLGPVSMQYKGLMNVIERDATAHRAVFQGRAQEARGQGTAQGTATLSLVETDGTTTGTVSAEVDLSGKVAAMGKSIIGSVTDQMMALFADNLQAMVTGSGTEPAAPPTGGEPASATVGAAPSPGQAGSPAMPPPLSRPLQHQAPRTAETSLNALTLAKGMLADQLSSPGKLVGLLAGVAFLAYRVGLAVGRRGPR
ncbi:carbon monoxide dehydrogenase [Cryobacterium algoritolerans]|uniref:Carbon monoxide dehydrogenase n=1 Tax=Cryobacterium algoritolerans TaxID=1259184 RepID=A0A4R8WL54_9MICO|nr:SRPBCC family protein [Cryobacterium algoritolerans]TFC12226.1 carbon monoxide dehydrogenase [Cryobacterium algoritolerans]